MPMNPYAFSLLQEKFNEQQGGGVASGKQNVGKSQQGLAVDDGISYDASTGQAIDSEQAPIVQQQSSTNGKLQGAAQGGQMGGVWGAVIGAALAKMQEHDQKEQARRENTADMQASFAAKLGYPMDEYRAKRQIGPEEKHATPGGEFTQNLAPGLFGRKGKGVFG